MRAAGKYTENLTWKQRTITKDTTNGQDVESFTNNGFLWCAIDSVTGTQRRDYGSEQTAADVIVRVRNYPSLSALDRLYSAKWDETYIIEDIGRGDDELICRCYRYDELEGT